MRIKLASVCPAKLGEAAAASARTRLELQDRSRIHWTKGFPVLTKLTLIHESLALAQQQVATMREACPKEAQKLN